MEKFTNEELLEVLRPQLRESKELTTKQKVVLGQLIIYNGLDKKNSEGYFFRSNKDLTNDCDIKEEKTVISAVNKLVMLGFIDTVRGSRKKGASLYRINQKTIDNYCKTDVDDYSKKKIDDYSKDYSKILTAMHVRITELEITVKRLADRITVIESRNYSTDTDIDKELDKEKELNNNILNKNSLYNNIKETESSKELETKESEENLTDFQVAISETPSEVETNNDEQTTIPTTDEKELIKQCNELINPFLRQVQSATSIQELNHINAKLVQAVQSKQSILSNISESAARCIDERIDDYFTSRAKEIKEMHSEEITKQLKELDQYASYYC